MLVNDFCQVIENFAPLTLQESYDNAGLLIGDRQMKVTGVLICVDVNEQVIDEAIVKRCNLIISHHPLIFNPIRQLTFQTDVQKSVAKAINNNIAVYAAHTNLDNIKNGVNGIISNKLGLKNTSILQPFQGKLVKLVCYVPINESDRIRDSLFGSGAGKIGNYDCCSYNMEGFGTFRAGLQAKPHVGNLNQLHKEPETRIEVILPEHQLAEVLRNLHANHPYEEPAFDIIPLKNDWQEVGAGILGEMENAQDTMSFLEKLKSIFNIKTIRHTQIIKNQIQRVAVCGGSGSFLIKNAIGAKADIFITADLKYHDFFDAQNRIILADVGHFESEQFTKDIFYSIITEKFTTFAVQISEINTNPIKYL